MKKSLWQTFHHNKYAAVVESVLLVFVLCVEAEGPIVKRLDVINLQWTVPFSQSPQNTGTAFEMVEHPTLGVVVDIAST